MAVDEPPVTVLGLGAMGETVARTFLDSGHPTTVWNRSQERAHTLVAHGAVRAETPRDAVTDSPIAIVCVTDDDAARTVLDAAGEAVAGCVLVNLTTGTPDQAERAAEWATARGAKYLDGVIQAGVDQVGTPEATLLYSGPRSAFAAHRTTLGLLGETHFVGSAAGQASLYDLALLGLWYDAELAYLQAIALIGSAGEVDPETFVPFAAKQLGYVLDAAPQVAREVRDRRYPRGPATLVEHAPVLDHLIQLRSSVGMNTDHLGYIRALVEQRIADGRTEDGFTALVEHLTTPRGGAS